MQPLFCVGSIIFLDVLSFNRFIGADIVIPSFVIIPHFGGNQICYIKLTNQARDKKVLPNICLSSSCLTFIHDKLSLVFFLKQLPSYKMYAGRIELKIFFENLVN